MCQTNRTITWFQTRTFPVLSAQGQWKSGALPRTPILQQFLKLKKKHKLGHNLT